MEHVAAVDQVAVPRRKYDTKYWTWKRFLQISVFWFGLSYHWSSILSIIIPKQIERFAEVDERGRLLALIAGAGGVVASIVQIVAGYYSDKSPSRYGRRRPFIMIGTLTAVFPLLALGFVNSATTLLLSMVFLQITLNIANGPYQAIIPDVVPPRLYGHASMWMGVLQNAGQALGPLVAGYLIIQQNGYAYSSLVSVVILLLCLWATSYVRERQFHPATTEKKSILHIFELPLRKYPYFLRLLWSRLAAYLGMMTVIDFLLYYVNHSLQIIGYEEATGALLALMVLGSSAGGTLFGPLADKTSKVKLLYISNSIAIVAAAFFVFCHTLFAARIIIACFGFGFGAFTVVDTALGYNLMPQENRGRYVGVWNLTGVLPQIFAPVLAGPLTDFIIKRFNAGIAYRASMVLALLYVILATYLVSKIVENPCEDEGEDC